MVQSTIKRRGEVIYSNLICIALCFGGGGGRGYIKNGYLALYQGPNCNVFNYIGLHEFFRKHFTENLHLQRITSKDGVHPRFKHMKMFFLQSTTSLSLNFLFLWLLFLFKWLLLDPLLNAVCVQKLDFRFLQRKISKVDRSRGLVDSTTAYMELLFSY